MPNDKVLVTGAAGFIGFHVAQVLLSAGREVVGLDNVNDYYDPRLKEARLDILGRQPGFTFVKMNLTDRAAMKALFRQHRFPFVVHVAARAGVRHSLDIRTPMSKPIWTVLLTSWKAAATMAANIWCSPRRPRSMAPTRSCHSPCKTMSAIRLVSTPRRKKPTN
jgi:NAD(P)-dependent dehydrogenase (short-subunit alcohol dehydrogenase family)